MRLPKILVLGEGERGFDGHLAAERRVVPRDGLPRGEHEARGGGHVAGSRRVGREDRELAPARGHSLDATRGVARGEGVVGGVQRLGC